MVDGFTREALGIEVDTRLSSAQHKGVLTPLFQQHGDPQFLRSDNGPGFVAKLLQQWLAQHCMSTISIEPGCPRQNVKSERFNGRLRHEWLNTELFLNVTEAKIRTEAWRVAKPIPNVRTARLPDEFKQAVRF